MSIKIRKDFTIEQSQKYTIYCIDWSKDCLSFEDDDDNDDDDDGPLYHWFAAVGKFYVSLYTVRDGNHVPSAKGRHHDINLLQAYRDNDVEEDFCACAFGGRSRHGSVRQRKRRENPRSDNDKKLTIPDVASSSPKSNDLIWPLANRTGSGTQLLCVAGKRGIIKVLDPMQKEFVGFLQGHGDEIYDLKVCPTDENLLLSASKDKSFRLWNLELGACVAIFGGHLGHADPVVSLSWHPTGKYIASGSGDATVKVWDIGPHTPVRGAIHASHKDAERWRSRGVQRIKQPLQVCIPCFTSVKLHLYVIDCVQFVGDMILSRDAEGKIVLWKPDLTRKSEIEAVIQASTVGDDASNFCRNLEYIWTFRRNFDEALAWFIRFTTDRAYRMLACGNSRGEVEVWDLATARSRPSVVIRQEGNRQYVRCLSFSPKNDFLMGASDDGIIWVWDVAVQS